jgi:hypothetical protein
MPDDELRRQVHVDLWQRLHLRRRSPRSSSLRARSERQQTVGRGERGDPQPTRRGVRAGHETSEYRLVRSGRKSRFRWHSMHQMFIRAN